jgi:hypothetical protein
MRYVPTVRMAIFSAVHRNAFLKLMNPVEELGTGGGGAERRVGIDCK